MRTCSLGVGGQKLLVVGFPERLDAPRISLPLGLASPADDEECFGFENGGNLRHRNFILLTKYLFEYRLKHHIEIALFPDNYHGKDVEKLNAKEEI